jgi:ABC-type multidrug transport system ATPase subunit
MQLFSGNSYNSSPFESGHMNIQLTDAGKRFNRDWIFRHVNYTFEQGRYYAITGPNGSGKSTLLQTISGAIAPSEGTVEYRMNNKHETANSESGVTEPHKKQRTWKREWEISKEKNQILTTQLKTENQKLETSNPGLQTENIFNHIAIVAPYLEVIEEMTATEFLNFHASFKRLLPTISVNEILEIVGLKTAAHKQIRFYSSGMKQRIKIVQAIFSDVPILLLDEPCTNLDASGYDLYHELINTYCKERLVIVSSNDANEYSFCEEKLSMSNYK